jgi:proteasome lid subunit RPN8/RPN11
MILVDRSDLAAVSAAAEAAFPGEGCGLLVGRGDRIVRVRQIIPAENLERERRNDRFELDPRVRFAAERALRGTPDRVLGHWHSHPNGSPSPSSIDIARAYEPEMIWLIVGVSHGPDGSPRATPPRAFRLDAQAGTARPVRLRLHPDAL